MEHVAITLQGRKRRDEMIRNEASHRYDLDKTADWVKNINTSAFLNRWPYQCWSSEFYLLVFRRRRSTALEFTKNNNESHYQRLV